MAMEWEAWEEEEEEREEKEVQWGERMAMFREEAKVMKASAAMAAAGRMRGRVERGAGRGGRGAEERVGEEGSSVVGAMTVAGTVRELTCWWWGWCCCWCCCR